MVISQGEIWWADLPAPTGSGPGFRRPVVVVQSDALNQSRISTAICVPLTSNLKWALAPGKVSLPARVTGLPKDSVANASQIISLDKSLLSERVSKLPRHKLELLFSGIDLASPWQIGLIADPAECDLLPAFRAIASTIIGRLAQQK